MSLKEIIKFPEGRVFVRVKIGKGISMMSSSLPAKVKDVHVLN
jgi:hypothetical protein